MSDSNQQHRDSKGRVRFAGHYAQEGEQGQEQEQDPQEESVSTTPPTAPLSHLLRAPLHSFDTPSNNHQSQTAAARYGALYGNPQPSRSAFVHPAGPDFRNYSLHPNNTHSQTYTQAQAHHTRASSESLPRPRPNFPAGPRPPQHEDRALYPAPANNSSNRPVQGAPAFGQWGEGLAAPLAQQYLDPREDYFTSEGARRVSDQSTSSRASRPLPIPPTEHQPQTQPQYLPRSSQPPQPPQPHYPHYPPQQPITAAMNENARAAPPQEADIGEERAFGSQETLYDLDGNPQGSGEKSSSPKDGLAAKPLRSALRRTSSEPNIAPTFSRTSSALVEEGGVRAEAPRRTGLFGSIFRGFGGDHESERGRERGRSRSRASSILSRVTSRASSVDSISRGQGALLDEDDPLVTGVLKEKKEKKRLKLKSLMEGVRHGMKRRESAASIVSHVEPIESRHEYILKLARALMELGAPSHRIEGQLIATARILGVQATFHRFLAKIDVTLEHPDTGISVTKPVHADARLDLGRLVRLHKIYKDVVHDNMGAEEGARKLRKLLDEPPIHGPKAQCALGFACGALICGLAFGGSPVDMLVAGTCSLFVQMLGGVAARVEMFAPIFEFTMAFFISTLARVLTSIPTSTQIFCYSAIATPGIVLILPGFLVVCGALDLASKNKEAGVIKIGAAFFHALFLGMGNAIGNSVGFLIFPAARRMREEAAKSMDHTLYSHGSFVSDNSTTIPSFSGSFAFSNHTELGVINQYHYRADGCYRDPSYSWTMRALPWWTQFFMVPLFCLVLSSLNGQPVNSLKAGWTMAVMVFIGCASYTVNTLINQYVFKQTEVVSMVGAFVVGILGIGYARWTKGTAFVVMVTAVLFMVPSGIAEAAELEDLQDFVIGNVGVRTVIVAIAITVGLNASTCVMYFFGRRKMGGVFAF